MYLEGTRSRSGKPSPPRAGMLSIVVDALCTGSIPDVLVVPVGISYDRIIEGNYNSEQLVRTEMMSVFALATKILPSITQYNKNALYIVFEFVIWKFFLTILMFRF